MAKRIFLLTLSACFLFLLAACRSQAPASEESRPVKETVALTVWGAEEDEALLQQIFASFKAHYAGQADFQITYQPQSESNCKDVLLGDLEGGADVFAFADDQVAALAGPPPAGWTPSRTRRPYAVHPSPPRWRRPAWATPCTPIR